MALARLCRTHRLTMRAVFAPLGCGLLASVCVAAGDAASDASRGRYLFQAHCAVCHVSKDDLVVRQKAISATGIASAINTVDRMADLKRLPATDLEAIAAYVRGDVGASDFVDYDGLWGGPDEAGWGLSISHQRANNRIFAVIYAYSADGSQQWLAVPEGVWSGDNTVWSGRAYQTRGAKGLAQFRPADVLVTPMGQATITFRSEHRAELTLAVAGSPAIVKPVERLSF